MGSLYLSSYTHIQIKNIEISTGTFRSNYALCISRFRVKRDRMCILLVALLHKEEGDGSRQFGTVLGSKEWNHHRHSIFSIWHVDLNLQSHCDGPTLYDYSLKTVFPI